MSYFVDNEIAVIFAGSFQKQLVILVNDLWILCHLLNGKFMVLNSLKKRQGNPGAFLDKKTTLISINLTDIDHSRF